MASVGSVRGLDRMAVTRCPNTICRLLAGPCSLGWSDRQLTRIRPMTYDRAHTAVRGDEPFDLEKGQRSVGRGDRDAVNTRKPPDSWHVVAGNSLPS